MTGFLTFAVYALRIASDMPIQSDYMPVITIYFLTSITYNMIAFFWFIYRNHVATKNDMPKFLENFGNSLKKVFCLCFRVTKTVPHKEETKKTNEPIAVTIPKEEVKKTKCRFCDRCSDCEAALKVDKDKRKKERESSIEAINYLFFIIFFIAIFVTQCAIWIKTP